MGGERGIRHHTMLPQRNHRPRPWVGRLSPRRRQRNPNRQSPRRPPRSRSQSSSHRRRRRLHRRPEDPARESTSLARPETPQKSRCSPPSEARGSTRRTSEGLRRRRRTESCLLLLQSHHQHRHCCRLSSTASRPLCETAENARDSPSKKNSVSF